MASLINTTTTMNQSRKRRYEEVIPHLLEFQNCMWINVIQKTSIQA